LVDGSIVEEGTHEELLARKSEYNRLYTLQFLKDERTSHGEILH
jgi:ABC-type multidrug transport system fused ATPase/permease subunit